MKNLFKILTILSFILITNLVSAQQADSLKTKPYVYCQIVGSRILFENKINIVVDDRKEGGLRRENILTSSDRRYALKFNSMIDALNYMSEQGWEFVQAYVTVEGDTSTTHWILKKRKE